MKTKEKTLTIKEKVEANWDALKTMDYRSLVAWAKENGIDNRQAYTRFRDEVEERGVEYNRLKNEYRDAKEREAEAELESVTDQITLYCDAKGSNHRFAITDEEGEVLYGGPFFENEKMGQAMAEMKAAKKTVWFARQVADFNSLEKVRLDLFVDAEWLCYANGTNYAWSSGGKAKELGKYARYMGVALKVKHVPGKDNLANAFTEDKGYVRWGEKIHEVVVNHLTEAKEEANSPTPENQPF